MRRTPVLSRVALAGLVLSSFASPARGQDAPGYATISARQFAGGSAHVTVTGSVEIDQEVPINVQASIADGEYTWLQFGDSGSEEPNALITYGYGEVGVSVGRGKFVVTAGNVPGEEPQCSDTVEVTDALVSARYTCAGITSYDSATGEMGEVDIDIRFTAGS